MRAAGYAARWALIPADVRLIRGGAPQKKSSKHKLEPSPIVLFAAAFLPAISACYLHLGRGLTLGRRLFASIHGLLALTVAPAGVFIDTKLAGTALEGGVVMATVAFVAIASIVYSIFALPQRWPAHLLHVLTTAIIGIGILAGGLYCCGH